MKIKTNCTNLLCTTAFLIFISSLCKAQNINNTDIDDHAEQLNQLLESEKYEEAATHIPILQNADSLSAEVLSNCIRCYEHLQQHDKCIEFCKQWVSSHPDDDYYFFYEAIGTSYYFLKDYNKAVQYLSVYIEEMEKNDELDGFYVKAYASSLYNTFNYSLAEKYFKKYLEKEAELEELSIETLNQSPLKDYYGNILYDYAYNSFFQGKEKEGYELLLLSKKCGNIDATEDCEVLEHSSTFNKDINNKNKTISEFNKYIKTLDYYVNIPEKDASQFWKYVESNNKQYQDLIQTIQKEKIPGTLKKAVDEVKGARSSTQQALNFLQPLKKKELEMNLEKFLYGEKPLINDLRIFSDTINNAFMTPFGDMYLSYGLVLSYHWNIMMLIGVCAHETAHYVFQHKLISLWDQYKKEKQNEIWSAVAVGLNTAAHTISAMYGASSGVQYDQEYWDNVSKTNISLMNGFELDAFYHQFKYSRSQELESDIIAYRFCEKMGIGGYAYIMALQLLGNDQGYMKADKESDHPTTSFRVSFLKYIYNKEHGNP